MKYLYDDCKTAKQTFTESTYTYLVSTKGYLHLHVSQPWPMAPYLAMYTYINFDASVEEEIITEKRPTKYEAFF